MHAPMRTVCSTMVRMTAAEISSLGAKTVFMFPGQGTQVIGMGVAAVAEVLYRRRRACAFPVAWSTGSADGSVVVARLTLARLTDPPIDPINCAIPSTPFPRLASTHTHFHLQMIPRLLRDIPYENPRPV